MTPDNSDSVRNKVVHIPAEIHAQIIHLLARDRLSAMSVIGRSAPRSVDTIGTRLVFS